MSNETNKETKAVHGYKVFNPDWTCHPIYGNKKQYTCPGKFEEEGKIEVCGHGMHFCKEPADCFRYYKFNSRNKVAEVIAYGRVVTKDNKSCTDKLEIVRELTWYEVLDLVNTGESCTGFSNSGNNNSGNYNSGDQNTGSYNEGFGNTGDGNPGNWNTGDGNIGYWNTGSNNTGDHNTGNNNTGNWNNGNNNKGYSNVGNNNVGDYNAGDWNFSSFNTGCFNTENHTIMLFDKPSEWSLADWGRSVAKHLLDEIPQDRTEWIHESGMTKQEKKENQSYKTTGGYLKELDTSGCAQEWWNHLSVDDKNIIKSIPNFDPDKFYKCTGIKVD